MYDCRFATIQNDFIELYEELNFLEERIESQRRHIPPAKLELEEEEVMFKSNEKRIAKYDQQVDKEVYTP